MTDGRKPPPPKPRGEPSSHPTKPTAAPAATPTATRPKRLHVRGLRTSSPAHAHGTPGSTSGGSGGSSPQAVTALAYRAATVWLALFALAFVNGAAREVLLVYLLGVWPHVAQQLSALTGILLFTGCVWVMWPWMRVRTLGAAWAVGGGWLVATALTEALVLNMWMGGMTLQQVAREYDVTRGKFWPLVLTWIGLLPPMVYGAWPFG